jgi:hypothetical protein
MFRLKKAVALAAGMVLAPSLVLAEGDEGVGNPVPRLLEKL